MDILYVNILFVLLYTNHLVNDIYTKITGGIDYASLNILSYLKYFINKIS